ncbi:MAG: energy-coupling factor ABC transporter substrate-binding protein [Chloroflexota bacterium]
MTNSKDLIYTVMNIMNEGTKRFSPMVYLVGILLILFLSILPLTLGLDSEFGGSDGAGSDLISEIAPDYDSEWITNIWSPPGGETESMLFALQATAGGVLIGYCFGYLRGRRRKVDN